MDQFVFSRPEVAQAMAADFVPVKIDAMRERELARRYQVDKWPTDVIVAPDGTKIAAFQGERQPQEYLSNLTRTVAKYRLHTQGLVGTPPGGGAGPSGGSFNQQTQYAQSAPPGYTPNGPSGGAPSGSFNGQPQGPFNGYQAGQYNNNGPAGDRRNPPPTNYNGYDGSPPLGNGQPGGDPYANHNSNLPPNRYDTASRHFQPPPNHFRAPGPNNQFGAPQNGFGGAPPAGQRWNPAANNNPPNGNGSFAGGPPPLDPSQMIVNDRYSMPPAPTGQGQFAQAQHNFQPSSNAAFGPQPAPPADHPPVALDGYCAVSLIDQQAWKKADPRWGAIHRGRTYLFAGLEQQQRFLANPDYYTPVLSGYDPVVFAETGRLVEGKRKHGVFSGDQKTEVYLFADEANLDRFSQAPQRYSEIAVQAMYQGVLNRR